MFIQLFDILNNATHELHLPVTGAARRAYYHKGYVFYVCDRVAPGPANSPIGDVIYHHLCNSQTVLRKWLICNTCDVNTAADQDHPFDQCANDGHELIDQDTVVYPTELAESYISKVNGKIETQSMGYGHCMRSLRQGHNIRLCGIHDNNTGETRFNYFTTQLSSEVGGTCMYTNCVLKGKECNFVPPSYHDNLWDLEDVLALWFTDIPDTPAPTENSEPSWDTADETDGLHIRPRATRDIEPDDKAQIKENKQARIYEKLRFSQKQPPPEKKSYKKPVIVLPDRRGPKPTFDTEPERGAATRNSTLGRPDVFQESAELIEAKRPQFAMEEVIVLPKPVVRPKQRPAWLREYVTTPV